jgi:hypothetical protein
MSSRRWPFIGITAILIVAGVVFIGRQGANRSPAKARLYKSGNATRQWERLERTGQKEARSISARSWPFSRIVPTTHQMPRAVRQKAEEVLGAPQHLNLQFRRAMHVMAPNNAVLWVVPGDGILCLFQTVPVAAACKPTGQAYRDGLVLQLYKLSSPRTSRSTRFTSLGIIPDGVKQIPVKIGRRWTTAPVEHNVFFIASTRPIGVPPLSVARTKRVLPTS